MLSKRLFLIIFIVLIFGLFFATLSDAENRNLKVATPNDAEKSWDFEEWRVDIEINKDSTFVVRETQTFNFQGNFHWVKRDILKKKLRKISDIKVFDGESRQLKGKEIEIKENTSQVNVKLNFDLTDVQKTWVFQYKVHGGLGYFEEHDELYWNAVSAEREVPIKEVEVFVHLPEEVPQGLKQKLYVGKQGSKTTSFNYEVVDSRTLHYWGDSIGPYENFTIVAGWPKGIIEPIEKKWWFIILRFLPFLIPLAVIALIIRRRLKAPRITKTIIAQYEPPKGLKPAEVGGLVDFKVQSQDLSAILIDLAYRGYMKIIEEVTKGIFRKKFKYSLEKLKSTEGDESLEDYEKSFLFAIFGPRKRIEVDKLKEKTTLRPYFERIRKNILKKLVKVGYFNRSPRGKEIQMFQFLGVAMIIGGLFIQVYIISLFLGLAVFLAGFIILIGSRSLSVWLTHKGAEAKWYALGFKEYLHVAERFRLGACTPETFEKYLSYAIAFKVEKKWAGRFVDIYKTPPDWYESSQPIIAFSVIHFTASISDLSHTVSRAVAATSASAASGFGGGGFAGGGGGGGGSSAG